MFFICVCLNSVWIYVLVMLCCLICIRWICRCWFVFACADAALTIVNVLFPCWLFLVVCVAVDFVFANVVNVFLDFPLFAFVMYLQHVCLTVLSLSYFVLCVMLLFCVCWFLRSFVCLLSCCHMLLNVCVVCGCLCLIAIVVFVDVFLLRFNFRDSVFAVIDCYVWLLRSVLLLLLIAFVLRLCAFIYIYMSDFMCAYLCMCSLRYCA